MLLALYTNNTQGNEETARISESLTLESLLSTERFWRKNRLLDQRRMCAWAGSATNYPDTCPENRHGSRSDR